jgi:hypothetical protein
MSGDQNELKSQMLVAARKLFDDHGISQDILFNLIRNDLTQFVKDLPAVNVLYNKCYGGFSYSEQFEKFVYSCNRDCTDCLIDRVKPTKYIVPFAKYILEMPCNEGLRAILYLYELYDLGCIFNALQEIDEIEKQKQRAKENIDVVRQYLESSDSKYATSMCILPLQVFDLSSDDLRLYHHTKEEVENVYAECKNGEFLSRYDTYIATHSKKLEHMPDNVIADMKIYVEQPKISRKIYSDLQKENQFVYALFNDGYHTPTTWRHTNIFNISAMKYLLSRYPVKIKRDHVFDFVVTKNSLRIDTELMEKVERKFGLLCASGAHAKLAIAEVPAKMRWRIEEYDGLESVYVV